MSEAGKGPAAGVGDEWFAEWFGDEYLALYGHRDDDEARRAVELVTEHVRPDRASPVLDLACGAGRHLRFLCEAGLRAFGLDLSEVLLHRAVERRLPVVRGDMRDLPVRPGSLAMVTSFFTSFGYFPDPRDDERVVEEVRRVLRPGGALAVDYLNAPRVRADLRPRSEETVRGRRVVQSRRLVDGGTVVEKRIEIWGGGDGEGEPRVFHERVRLYDAGELAALMRRHGIEPTETYGDYGGGPLRPDGPRAIVIGRLR